MYTKILQVTAAYKPAFIYGGPTMSVAKLCEALAEIKVEVEVLTTTANGKEELPVEANKANFVDGVKVTYFKRLTKDHTHFSPALLLGLRREIKALYPKAQNFNPQLIIHIHAWWNLVSIFSCVIAKWYNVPVMLTPRGMLTDYTATNRNSFPKRIIHAFLGKILLKYCHIHVTSEKEKRDVLSIIKPKSITVIPNLVELEQKQRAKIKAKKIEENHKDLNTSTKPFKLIFLSRIEEKKGLELLFEALSSLSLAWSLTIAGSGEKDYVESLKLKAKNLKIENSINWVGQIKNEDKFNLLAEHDLMVLISYNENFANVVIESLSVGTPVLLSNEVGLADYVEEKKLGWITDLTPKNITEQLIKSFEAKNSRAVIRETAPQIIIEDFDSKNLIKKYFKLYSQIK
jgi:glycosyltransferase involved in cell wall biosynthesis